MSSERPSLRNSETMATLPPPSIPLPITPGMQKPFIIIFNYLEFLLTSESSIGSTTDATFLQQDPGRVRFSPNLFFWGRFLVAFGSRLIRRWNQYGTRWNQHGTRWNQNGTKTEPEWNQVGTKTEAANRYWTVQLCVRSSGRHQSTITSTDLLVALCT